MKKFIGRLLIVPVLAAGLVVTLLEDVIEEWLEQ